MDTDGASSVVAWPAQVANRRAEHRSGVTGPARAESHLLGANREPGRLIWNLSSTDVPADFERFKAAGATVVAELYHPEEDTNVWIATFADPDSNYFQIASPM